MCALTCRSCKPVPQLQASALAAAHASHTYGCTRCRSGYESAPFWRSALNAVSTGALREPRRAAAGRGPGGQHARGARPIKRGDARAQGPGRGGRAGRVRRRGRRGRRCQPHPAGVRRGLGSITLRGTTVHAVRVVRADLHIHRASALLACAHPESGSEAGILRLECSFCVSFEQARLVRMHVSLISATWPVSSGPACQRARGAGGRARRPCWLCRGGTRARRCCRRRSSLPRAARRPRRARSCCPPRPCACCRRVQALSLP
jgi:hypothetical protein